MYTTIVNLMLILIFTVVAYWLFVDYMIKYMIKKIDKKYGKKKIDNDEGIELQQTAVEIYRELSSYQKYTENYVFKYVCGKYTNDIFSHDNENDFIIGNVSKNDLEDLDRHNIIDFDEDNNIITLLLFK